MGKDKKVPLLWKALGNRYTHKMEFATAPDPKGTILAALGLTADDEKKGAKVVIYAPDSDEPVLYSGAFHPGLSDCARQLIWAGQA